MVISNEHVIYDQVYGPVRVVAGGRLMVRGQVVGDAVTVQSGGHAAIQGMVQQVVVEQGGSVELHGTCSGDVHNLGGDLVISGTVGGTLIGRSYTRILQGAQIDH